MTQDANNKYKALFMSANMNQIATIRNVPRAITFRAGNAFHTIICGDFPGGLGGKLELLFNFVHNSVRLRH